MVSGCTTFVIRTQASAPAPASDFPSWASCSDTSTPPPPRNTPTSTLIQCGARPIASAAKLRRRLKRRCPAKRTPSGDPMKEMKDTTPRYRVIDPMTDDKDSCGIPVPGTLQLSMERAEKLSRKYGFGQITLSLAVCPSAEGTICARCDLNA